MTSPEIPPAPPLPRRSLDAYECAELLAEGGTAAVYRARHRETGHFVALKILRTAGLDPSWPKRFAREVRAVSSLKHPNIARIVDHGESDSELFIAFELIDGGTVLELKERMGGTLPVPVAIEVFAQLLAALEYAHAAEIIHRDIKPGNVMLTSEGVVKLVDFGIARVHDDVPLTQSGVIVGTPAFMSPEQVEGDPADERSDLFSAGLVLYDMLVGESPFFADTTAATILRLMREEVPLLSENAGGVPWALERIHSRIVDRDRERRPVGADLVLDDLKPLLRVGRDRWPRLLADAVARPAETSSRLRREAAQAEVLRAEELRARHGPHPSAVLALHDAVRIDPTLDEAMRRLLAYEEEAGVVVGRARDDTSIREVRAGLQLQPRQAVLWRRLADLRRLRAEPFDEAIALKHVLRLRKDPDAERRLHALLHGPADSSSHPAILVDDGNDPSTTSVHQVARRGTGWARLVFPGRSWLLPAVSLIVGMTLGAAAMSGSSSWGEEPQAPPPPPPARRSTAKEVVVSGLTATVGPSSTSLLHASGRVVLGGPLDVELSPGFLPGPADSFVIVRAGSIEGAFVDGGRAAVRPRGTFDVEVRDTEVALVRYDPNGSLARRDGPRVALVGPAVVNLWGARCTAEMASWPQLRKGLAADVHVVHVARSLARSKSLRLALEDRARMRRGARVAPREPVPVVDADGTRFFGPLGVTDCATVVVDKEGRVRLRTTPSTPNAATVVRRTVEALATELAFVADTTPSLGERVERLRSCRPLVRCAVENTTAWSVGAPVDAAAVDACLLGCDPGAVPRDVVLAAARAALAAEDPDESIRLLEPWRTSTFADVHRALGDAYLKARRLAEARAHLERYLELAPDADDAEAVRRELSP